MTTLLFNTADDGPGPVLEDPDERHAVIHGAYGMIPIAKRPTRDVHLIKQWAHVTLTWTQVTPFEVSLMFIHPATGRRVPWTIARDLLRAGTADVIAGDVRVRQLGEHVWIQLTTPTGDAAFALSGTWLDRFLDATYEIVPSEREWDTVEFPDDLPQARDKEEPPW